VVIDEDVETIAVAAFRGCGTIQTIDFSRAINLTTIGARAFKGCRLLTVIDLTYAGNGVDSISIGNEAFSAAKIASVTFPAAFTVDWETSEGINLKPFTSTKIIDGTGISDSAYQNWACNEDVLTALFQPPLVGCPYVYSSTSMCTSLAVGGQGDSRGASTCCTAPAFDVLIIKDHVTQVGIGAFSQCPIKHVVISPSSMLETIGDYAFFQTHLGAKVLSSIDFSLCTRLRTIGIR
jgi:hypothetical protein